MFSPAISVGDSHVYLGSCLDVLPTLADNSVDSIVTDPPYELGFMGKSWDNSGIAYNVEVWRECLRVLKPGGHILAFGGSRTWHRLAVAIEDAGFELRDSIAWIYGSGFPKSLDVSKAIDKAAGAEREVVARRTVPDQRGGKINSQATAENGVQQREVDVTESATPEAQKWNGWGTALKPAFEPVVVGRKPFAKGSTVAANVLEWGVGGLNIDGTRIGTESRVNSPAGNKAGGNSYNMSVTGMPQDAQAKVAEGRWPSNVMLDEYTAGLVDEQQKDVSRFFYVAKASKRDRNEGLDEIEAQSSAGKGNGLARICEKCGASILKPCNCEDRTFVNPPVKNFHPTVKPTDLMRQLIRLVTPPGGTVLDPFTGSGSTGKAAILEGFQFVGIELTEEYLPIIEGRLIHASQKVRIF
jgi:DNA modification methylase